MPAHANALGRRLSPSWHHWTGSAVPYCDPKITHSEHMYPFTQDGGACQMGYCRGDHGDCGLIAVHGGWRGGWVSERIITSRALSGPAQRRHNHTIGLRSRADILDGTQPAATAAVAGADIESPRGPADTATAPSTDGRPTTISSQDTVTPPLLRSCTRTAAVTPG